MHNFFPEYTRRCPISHRKRETMTACKLIYHNILFFIHKLNKQQHFPDPNEHHVPISLSRLCPAPPRFSLTNTFTTDSLNYNFTNLWTIFADSESYLLLRWSAGPESFQRFLPSAHKPARGSCLVPENGTFGLPGNIFKS